METSASRRKRISSGQFGTAVTRWAIYLLFFLVPLTFLPWTTNVLEVNKQIVLVVLTSVALLAWLGRMVSNKQVSFRSGLLNLFPLLFLGAVLLSSIFSVGGFQTWLGQASQEYVSFLTIATLVLLFYTLANNAHETRVQQNILFSLLLSSVLSSLITVLGIFDLFHLPFAFAQGTGFNTVGTLNSFTGFLSIVMFAGLALWLVSSDGRASLIPEGARGVLTRAYIVWIALVTVFFALAIDFWVIWVVLIFGVGALVMFQFVQTKAFPHTARLILPMLVLVISLVFLFLPTPLRLPMPVVVSPGYQLSWQVAQSTLAENTTRVLFGSGPGTFMFDYAKYKPVEVNASPFWNVRFDRAKSHALTIFATLGVVGILVWAILVIGTLLLALARLLKHQSAEEWKMTYVFFVAWIVAALSHILYSSNMTIQFLFWAMLGLLASQLMTKVRTSNFNDAPRLALVSSFAFVLVGVGVVASLFISGQRYASEMAFAKAVELDRQGASSQEVVQALAKATGGFMGSQSDIYFRNISSALLAQARTMLAELDPETMTQEQLAQIQALVASSINASVQATTLGPAEVSNWVVRGAIYRDVMNFVTGAEDFAAATFMKAIELEPVNPSHHTNLGRVHLAVAERARTLKAAEDPELAAQAAQAETVELLAAEEAFNKAIELKPDYAPAHYYLAAAFERQGKLEDAAKRMAALRNVSPSDVGLAFQLSLLLLRLEEYDLARGELERIVTIAPEYSNALWFLASAYEIQGNQPKAIEAVAKVAELNPDNQLVQDRLARMRAGEVTTLLPGGLQQPIEEGETGMVEAPEGEVVEGGEAAPVEEPAPEAPVAE